MILVSSTSFKNPSICSKRWIALLKAARLFDFIIKIGEGPILLNTIGFLGLLVYAFVLLRSLGLHAGAFAANPQIAAEFADPSDHIVHLAVGLLALWGWINRPR